MKVVLFACVVLAVCQIALAAEEGASLPKWIRPENKAWPAWGSIHMRWLQREAAEANRDFQDARAELAVVKSWAASYVRHRSDEVTVRVRNRNHECASFNRLVQIRKHNFLYHNTVHQRIAHFHKVRTMGDSLRRRLIQKHGPQKGAELYKTRYRARYEKWLAKREAYYQQKFNSKYSEHARMLLTSKDRFLSAQKAYNNCRITVARLLKHRLDVVNVAKKTGDAAVLRSQKHVNSTAARFKKVVLKIKKLRAAMIQRFKQSKIHFFHRCRRVGAYKYKCFFSVMHGGKQYRRQPFRFHKCIWAGATTAVVRYVCYK